MEGASDLAGVAGIDALWQRVLADSFEEIYVFDAQTLRFIQVSRGAVQNLGYSQEELRERTARDLKPELSPRQFDDLIRPLLNGEQELVVFETRHRRKDGSYYPVEVRLQLARETTPPVFIAIILDRTEQQRAERELRNNEQRFRELVEQSPFGIQRFSPDGRLLSVNASWKRLFGASLDDLRGYNIFEDRQLIDTGVMPWIERGFAGEASEIPATVCEANGPAMGSSHDASPSRCHVRTFVYPIRDVEDNIREVILMYEDVTERERVLAALQESEKSLAEAQRIAHLGSWRLDLRTNRLNWSDEIFRIFEIDPSRFGASYEAFLAAIHPEDRERVDAAYRASLEERRPYQIEHRLLMPDGRVKYVQERGETRFDEDGQPLVSMGTVQDITERALAEQELRKSEQRFNMLAQISPVGIFRTDAEGRCTYVNRRWLEMAGMEREQALGDGWADAIHPEDRQKVLEAWQRSTREQAPFQMETRCRRKPLPDGRMGRINWILAQASAERDEQGRVIGYLGTTTDITHQKRIEMALSRLAVAGSGESVFQRLVEGLATLFDAQKAFVCRLNQGDPCTIENLATFGAEAGSGAPCSELDELPCGRVVEQGETVTIVANSSQHFGRLHCALGRLSDSESYIGTPIFAGAGKVIGVLGIVDDKPLETGTDLRSILEMFAARAAAEIQRQEAEAAIRDQRDRLEQEVQERTAALRASNQELESFAYSVSHDLRAPLRAIDGFSQALLDDYLDRLDGEGAEYLRRVRAASQRMGQLIDDMLQLSRVTRGDFIRDEIDFSGLAHAVIQRLQEHSPRPQAEVVIEPDMRVRGDRRLLGVMLDNLLGNAWKYTARRERPHIEFGCYERDGQRIYRVRDNGVGFDMKYVDQIFTAFQRLHPEREFEGSGVGLATVQRIVGRHGGRIWAEAKPDEGATFYFTLGESSP